MVNQLSKPIAVDLFAGCGGISCGLSAAGFQVVAGADSDPKFFNTFRRNFPNALHLEVDLSNYHPNSLMSDLGIAKGELDLLAGGPPCQGFSKNVPRRQRVAEDPNNLLVRVFLDYCEALAPRTILMENVAEMKNGYSRRFSDEIIERLDVAGYSVSEAVLNAAEYGVPQRRQRAFFIAVKGNKQVLFPEPTHSLDAAQLGLLDTRKFVSVWDAIGDLPSLEHGEGEPEATYACAPFSQYQSRSRNGRRYVTNHVARPLRPKQYARIASLRPGQGLKDLPEHLKVRSGYSGAYGRLTKDMLAPTITRWVFHPGSGRWGHPVDLRTLTIREAARIQGFPDDFDFEGSFVQQSGQIGNAVPPLLIEQLARAIREQSQL